MSQPLNSKALVNVEELYTYIYCPRCKNKLALETIDKELRKKCIKCSFVFWNNPKPVVSIILHQDKKVIMLQRAKEPLKGYWCLPGGFIGYSETAENAIKREVDEELGQNAKINGILDTYRIDDDPRGAHIDIIFYGTVNGNPKLSNENSAYDLFSPYKLPKQIAYKHREAINDWSKKMKTF